MKGKILIVNKLDGSIFGWFGEVGANKESSRPDIENIILLELEPQQYQEEFMNLTNGLNSLKVIDIENKILEFDLRKENTETEEQRLKREKQELENQLLLMENEKVGGIL